MQSCGRAVTPCMNGRNISVSILFSLNFSVCCCLSIRVEPFTQHVCFLLIV